MDTSIPYVISQDIIPGLIQFCQNNSINRLYLVADQNTYRVLGEHVLNSLQFSGIDVKPIIITGNNIHTDEHFIVQAMLDMTGEERAFIGVGSGTITDITRFISHRSRVPFISIPTAPSVDGYTSTVAPMVVGNYKAPIQAQPPIAVFAHLPTLCESPRNMIAAGLGDLLGKYTSLADWKIGHLLYEEPFNEKVYKMMLASVDQTVAIIEQVADATCEGITRLMDGLVGSGFGMLEFGDSRPASGSEHHIAHYWEMQSIMEGKPATLHGTEVGIATILSAKKFEYLRNMTKSEAVHRLSQATLPTDEALIADINRGYGPVADKIINIQSPLFKMTQRDLDQLKTKISDLWENIQNIASEVPSPNEISDWIRAAGGPVLPQQIGLDENKTVSGLRYAHYLRDRFTLNRLAYWLRFPLTLD